MSLSPEESLKLLIEGNERYARDELQHPNRSLVRREAISAKQTPFAVILGCSDSRVSPEIIFDQGLGDLFVVRIAGNVVGPVELDSIEFSAAYLHSSLILVLGHEQCGAVQAVFNGQIQDIEAIADRIRPAIVKSSQDYEKDLENSIKNNVRMVVEQVKSSEVISKLIRGKKVDVIGGYYRLTSGDVEFLR